MDPPDRVHDRHRASQPARKDFIKVLEETSLKILDMKVGHPMSFMSAVEAQVGKFDRLGVGLVDQG